ncbi:MAG: phosphoribosyl-AMP cyclohydrolase [Hyphomicrobiaceae bacterium]|jgi:phosphoribosyl-AMP cyclohydrolase
MSHDDKHALEEGAAFKPGYNADGLIPAIASDHDTGEVLMVAWMNAEALDHTLRSGVANFWSRSRAKLWCKGEESGNTLRITEIRTDCDQDVLWLRVNVEGDGKACHTGRRTCFYRVVEVDNAGSVTLRTD